MARKVVKNEKTPLQNAAAVLLKKQGKTYEEWSQKIVSDNCLSLLQGGNPEWRNKMLEGAAMDLIAASVVEEEKKNKTQVQSDAQSKTNHLNQNTQSHK
ncbi:MULTISPECIES: hypothetical protein [Bacillus cereus group]|uniref:hypothetical protein n=1 Tax=Bacillus cereus group TaxID=86661 RepID=UPI0018799113|nr:MULTISPECIES: hypothetical protein [Bacillus cereus group]MBE7145024.1 hypothetical protein [Bacillus paranthracis]MCU5212901.1 hypothetical protein [Bacillus paranthracis]MDA2593610.1 hypothetical protein [Bacillus cereus group sp. Bc065]HDR7527029.1 hypothetical protein [Bacillus paranthracis]